MDDVVIGRAIAYIKTLFAGNSGGHDAAHTLRVYRLALRIADTEPGCDRQTVALAALLHDADDHKLFHSENNQNARRFLTENDIPEHQIDAICAAINSVSFSQNRGKTPATPEGRIVQDADRLDALGAVGIARTFAYGGEHGRPLEESVQHFYDKLLLLKDGMHTAEAKRIAQERHTFLADFLHRIEKEMET